MAPLATLALAGCMVPHPAPVSPPGSHGPGCTDISGELQSARWWACLDDAPLSALILRAPAGTRDSLPAEIAQRYVALRARQSALVLLAAREELDERMVANALRPQPLERDDQKREPVFVKKSRENKETVASCDSCLSHEALATAQAQLARTRADQQQTRAEIAGLRDGLAMLVGAAPGALDSLPGGPIPLPPSTLVASDPFKWIVRRADVRHARSRLATVQGPRAMPGAALVEYRRVVLAALRDAAGRLARYRAARAAASGAQAQAEQASAAAAQQDIRAQAGTLGAEPAIAADRQALDALQAEQQARAAMTRAYLALVGTEQPYHAEAR